MKFTTLPRITAPVIAAALAMPAHADSYYGYQEQDHHGEKHHISNTEKAVAGVLVAGLAVAAAKAASQNHQATAHQINYAQPQAVGGGHDNTVIVRIRGVDGGPVPIYLRRSGNGFVGPRGEYYAALPNAQSLGDVYGPGPQPAAEPQPVVHVEQGRVVVIRGGRILCVLRPAMPNIEQFRLTNHDQQLVVKSRGGHGPSTVELFNLSNGTINDKVLGFAIRKGQPKWAKGMED
jgi:hypothetical protein